MKVSVVMITYGHEQFIAQAIEGVLMQETNFSIELIIANDHSPDRTHEMVQNYINNHPKGHMIRYFQNEKNMGMMPNFIFGLNQTKGKYIALCEGDDYWTDPLKLQKQVDFLEANKNINLCFHQVNYVNINKKSLENPQYQFDIDKSQFLSYEFLIESWGINNCSVVFRKVFSEVPSILIDYKVGDQPLFYFISLDKPAYYFSDIMSNYRITDTGVTGTFLKNKLKSDIEFPFLDKINELTNKKYSATIKKRKSKAIIKDLRLMRTSDVYTIVDRAQFYFKNFFYLLNNKKGIKVSAYCFFKYVI